MRPITEDTANRVERLVRSAIRAHKGGWHYSAVVDLEEALEIVQDLHEQTENILNALETLEIVDAE